MRGDGGRDPAPLDLPAVAFILTLSAGLGLMAGVYALHLVSWGW